jgi:hypothetical protein
LHFGHPTYRISQSAVVEAESKAEQDCKIQQ